MRPLLRHTYQHKLTTRYRKPCSVGISHSLQLGFMVNFTMTCAKDVVPSFLQGERGKLGARLPQAAFSSGW